MVLALLLAERPRTVEELAAAAEMPLRRIESHLAPLCDLGVVSPVRAPDGSGLLYDLCCEGIRADLLHKWD